MKFRGNNKKGFGSRTRLLESVVFILACVVFVYAFTMFPDSASAGENDSVTVPVEIGAAIQDFSKFPHTNAMHARLPCLLCHKRDDNSPKPKRSTGHSPCVGCHVQQFADNTSPMCLICHLPGSTAVKPFPTLRSFNVKFDHSRHTRQTNCATCHKSAGRGVSFSIPTGPGAHVTCYQCHGPRTEVGGQDVSSCSTCHQVGRPVRPSLWAKAYTENFSHQAHIRAGNTNCTVCHTVRAGGVRGKQVSTPLALNHSAPAGAFSCATCHNNKRAFGGDDFKDCRRCHTGKNFKF